MFFRKATSFRVFVAVCVITLVTSSCWLLLSSFGVLARLENMAMDWRYRFRGEVPSALNIVYVNLDSQFISRYGEKPFNRTLFADVGRMVLEEGGANTLFYDFVFSPLSNTSLVTREMLEAADNELAGLVYDFPNKVVLAGTYSSAQTAFMEQAANIPLMYRDNYDPAQNAYPETPIFPIWNGATVFEYEGETPHAMYPWGQVGLINVDYELSRDSVPRYLVAFVEVSGETHALQSLTGLALASGIRGASERVGETDEMFIIRNEAGDLQYGIPKKTNQLFLTAPLELLRAYHAAEGIPMVAEVEGDVAILRQLLPSPGKESIRYEVPLSYGQIIEINWLRSWNSERHFSMDDILEWKSRLDRAREAGDEETVATETRRLRDIFEGAIVLCGPVAPLLQDLAPTPYNEYPVPRVGIHGNAVDAIYQGLHISRSGDAVKVGLVVSMALLAACLGVYSGRFVFVVRSLIVLGGVFYFLLVMNVFRSAHHVLPLVAPLGTAVTSALSALIYKTILEEKKRGRITGLFGTYVSPELVLQMVESEEEPKLGGETAEITAFFSDVQSFSTFSEVLSPEQLVDLMNEYLDAMTVILQDAGGTLDKYIGDAVVAMYGAPLPLSDHALRACVATQLMHRRLAELRSKWRNEGERWPSLVYDMQARIGLNTGPATVGNMGSSKRFNYTMMGDTVNLAARCESGAKAYGVYTMITEQTKIEAEAAGDACVFRFLDRIIVKGRSQPAGMFEIVCLREDLTAEARECLAVYDEGMEMYLKQDFQKAAALFERSARLEPNRSELNPISPTTPSDVMRIRCLHLLQNPPEGEWDGVFRMKTK